LILNAGDISQLVTWVREAGQIALGYFRNVNPERKPDRTYLTQADLEVEAFLVERLRTRFPDFGLIGEEGSRRAEAQPRPNIWAIDPIDGTTAFVQGLPGWGISIGLLRQGQPHFGLYYMPLLDDVTYTGHDGRVYLNQCPLTAPLRTDWSDKGYLAINSTAHHDFQIDVKRTRALGSIGANLVYTVRGSATATLMTRASLWDIVAGGAMLDKIGGELRYLSGRRVDYTTLLDGRPVTEPILAGHPDLLAGLANKIKLRAA
ncbi:MAG: inositol monophosphatase, partial [Anaerolineae bacterium]|nr:inositol monophosphatase [Anaerolineae bacterium]